HEVAEMAFVLHVLRPSDKFIDVGANVGSYTVLAAGAVGSRVFAVEPIPTTFGFLRRNVALNGLGELVRCWQGGGIRPPDNPSLLERAGHRQPCSRRGRGSAEY